MAKYSCGGKVIVLGEYACLQGYDALVAITQPAFSLNTDQDCASSNLGLPSRIHAESPAGKLLKRYQAHTSSVVFHDPYATPIGVGSSSAQFLLFWRWLNPQSDPVNNNADRHRLMTEYFECATHAESERPSGVDVLAQLYNAFGVVHPRAYSFSAVPSPKFSGVLLLFTGQKMKTHEHLRELSKKKLLTNNFVNDLNDITQAGIMALRNIRSDLDTFYRSINQYQELLSSVIPSPKDYINKMIYLKTVSGVYAVKGCGAQGGDSVLMFYDRAKQHGIQNAINAIGWQPFPMVMDK